VLTVPTAAILATPIHNAAARLLCSPPRTQLILKVYRSMMPGHGRRPGRLEARCAPAEQAENCKWNNPPCDAVAVSSLKANALLWGQAYLAASGRLRAEAEKDSRRRFS
jgi:hypothetical protein